jgi:chromosomal replication initiator protein
MGVPSSTGEKPAVPQRGTSGIGSVEGLNPRYMFDTFVVGSSNQFAQAASQAVAELPSRAYNPLFIYGGRGLGKTHLLHAVGHQTSRFPCDDGPVAGIGALHQRADQRHPLRSHRGVPGTLSHHRLAPHRRHSVHLRQGAHAGRVLPTFNDLYESRKQIIVSSDSSPTEIHEIEERLRSRFEWGFIVDIQPPISRRDRLDPHAEIRVSPRPGCRVRRCELLAASRDARGEDVGGIVGPEIGRRPAGAHATRARATRRR